MYGIFRNDDPYQYFTGLGSTVDIEEDDSKYVFSYYMDGKEAIYSANIDGTNVKKLTELGTEKHHDPKFSYDGTKILFLSEDEEGVNSLYIENSDGRDLKKLASKNLHISEAVFSSIDDTIYYVATPLADGKKSEGEIEEGYDLYSVGINGNNNRKLTNKDYFSMSSLAVSEDGKEVFYSFYNGEKEKFYSYSMEERKEKETAISEQLPKESYSHQFSANGNKLLYTAVPTELQNSSPYEYELFLLEENNREAKQLTKLHSNISSPRFFHHNNKVAFLENTNWSSEPAKFRLRILDLDTEKLQTVTVDIEKPAANHLLSKTIDQLDNGLTIAILYTALAGLLTTYQYVHSKKVYLPVIISFCLTIAMFIASFIFAAAVNPWFGIGLGMVSASLFGCTLIVFIYAFVLKVIEKREKVS